MWKARVEIPGETIKGEGETFQQYSDEDAGKARERAKAWEEESTAIEAKLAGADENEAWKLKQDFLMKQIELENVYKKLGEPAALRKVIERQGKLGLEAKSVRIQLADTCLLEGDLDGYLAKHLEIDADYQTVNFGRLAQLFVFLRNDLKGAWRILGIYEEREKKAGREPMRGIWAFPMEKDPVVR